MNDNFVELTVKLGAKDFATAVRFGLDAIKELSEHDVTIPDMPSPEDGATAHEIAAFGVQELVGCKTARWEINRSPNGNHQDESTPF